MKLRPRHLLLLAALSLPLAALAQAPLLSAQAPQLSTQAPELSKVDPPNWWANMPPAMLLVRGENLTGARFRLADKAVRIDHTVLSPNGHWAELWLANNPARPLSTTLTVETAAGRASLPFRFEPRRPATDGFAGFSSADVMYLIMPDRFADGDLANDGPDANEPATSPEAINERARPKGWHGGDLPGITAHLDYLQQLGITTVWITPIDQNHGPEAYHGYHATDMYAVDPHFGSLADLQALAKALHARHMKLVLDTVPNHVGPFHPWVDDEPATDWFHGSKASHRPAETNFLPLINPHAPWRDQRDITEGWFVDLLPDMDQESPAVSRYLIQNAIWWTEQAGLDGLRIDTFPYVGRQFWHDFHAALFTLYPHLTDVGEVSDGDPLITSAYAAGVTRDGVDTGLWTPFDFPFHYALRNVFATGAPMTELSRTLSRDSLYPHPERLVPFLDNHDQIRFMSEPGATATGERLALAVLLTTRGTPQLYTGDELAERGGDDPDNRRDFPGGFPSYGKTSSPGTANPTTNQPSAFTQGTRTPAEQAMFTWTAQLLTLRNSQPALQTGTEEILLADKDTFVFTRNLASTRVLVAVHRGASTDLAVDTRHTSLDGATAPQTLFGSGTLTPGGDGSVHLNLAADSVLVISLNAAQPTRP